MRRLALLGLLALAGCGTETDAEGGACAATLVYEHDVYGGIADIDGVHAGGAVEAVLPACYDSRGAAEDEDRTVWARRIRGIDPGVALMWAGDVYVNAGHPSALREHPLHDAIHGGPNQPRTRMRGKPCAIEGEVFDVFWDPWIRTNGGDVHVAIDAGTRIVGLERDGLPYLAEGDHVRVTGRCRGEAVGARRIEPRG